MGCALHLDLAEGGFTSPAGGIFPEQILRPVGFNKIWRSKTATIIGSQLLAWPSGFTAFFPFLLKPTGWGHGCPTSNRNPRPGGNFFHIACKSQKLMPILVAKGSNTWERFTQNLKVRFKPMGFSSVWNWFLKVFFASVNRRDHPTLWC